MTGFQNYFLLIAFFMVTSVQSSSPERKSAIAAFPQAEGAARFVSGGRGGDVYHVSNLNDSGYGSLRHGIESADGPRTIVFDIGGIIFLKDRLESRASNLTIAGQTAPGGGIVIAHRSFFVIDSQNVIIQNIRFVPGDGLTRPGSEDLPGHISTADGELPPRALRIWGSQDVMVDHVTTRWGQEDNIGVTHDSRNVTIQNSFITEALYRADHPKGARSYGAMAGNSYNFSFLNNLFAHNRARNPRVFGNNNLTLLEFSNNTIYHPGGWIGLFTDGAFVNFRGNSGITGPMHDGPSAMIQGDPTARVYIQNNIYDRNSSSSVNLYYSSEPLIDGPSPVHTPFHLDSGYEPVSPKTSYIHQLSRGGASVSRDLHDRRVVKNVVERSGRYIDRPEDAGGYGNVEPGLTVVSTSRDGIADWWKEARGIDVNKSYHQVFADDGYTFLEHYLWDLMQPVRIPEKSIGMVIEADEWHESDWPDTGFAEFHMLRFNLHDVTPGSVVDAQLVIPGVLSGTKIMARDPFNAAENWDPGNRLIPIRAYKKNPWPLGKSDTDGIFDDANLSVFINNSLAHYPEAIDPQILTLLIVAPMPGNAKYAKLMLRAQKEYTVKSTLHELSWKPKSNGLMPISPRLPILR